MFKIEIEKKVDGYHEATIASDNGFLNYMYIPTEGYKTMSGKINNVSIRNDGLSLTGWQKNGRGKLSKEIKDIILEMNSYFYSQH